MNDDNKSSTEKIIQEAIENKSPVFINFNNESDIGWKYSVALCDIEDFWLDSFETLEKAKEYCEKNGLPVKIITGE